MTNNFADWARLRSNWKRSVGLNPLALEEFQALEKRHQFLAEQLDDVVASKKDLLAIIDDLDGTMRDVFLEAFEDTKRAFDEVFPHPVPGWPRVR